MVRSPKILLEEVRREADVSAEQSEEEEDPRIPDPHADPGGPTHPGSAQDQGPGRPVGLNVSVPLTTTTRRRDPSVRSSYSKIRRAADIGDVRRRGKRYGEGRVVVYVLPSGDGTKVGFVSSRTVGGAVARNRARRLMREAWRGLAPRVRSNYDVVAVARSEIRGAKMQDVMVDLERALHAAGLITP
jgi:ribonuclease P protein component